MSIVSSFQALSTPAKIATSVAGGAVVIGGAAFLASCASPKESKDVVREEFNKFDRDGQDGVGLHEAEINWEKTYTTTYDNRIGDSDLVNRTFITRQKTWTDSALRGVGAADERGNQDAVASWQELTNLAMTYDTDGDKLLSRDERNKFNRDYGVQVLNEQTRIIDESTRLVIDPLPRYEPPTYYPPSYEPPTSGGDSGGYGNGGYDSGDTSNGDSGGYGTGTDYGNSSGDSGGYSGGSDYGDDGGYSGGNSGGDSGGYSGGSDYGDDSGNSTSNGNAEW